VPISNVSDELYDELANKVEATDDSAARRVYRELLKAGRSRQEIVLEVLHVIEKRSAGNPDVGGTRETSWLSPHRSFGTSQIEGIKKRNAGPDPPTTSGANRYRSDIGVEQASLGIARTDTDPARRADVPTQFSPKPQTTATSKDEEPISERKTAQVREPAVEPPEERRDAFLKDTSAEAIGLNPGQSLSVTERLGAKLRLQSNLPAAEAKLTAPAEALAVTEIPPRNAQHGSRASARRPWPVLIGTSAVTAAVGFFVMWSLFGSDIEGIASTWLDGLRGSNVLISSGPAKPTEEIGQPEQSTAGHQSDEMPKQPPMRDTRGTGTQTETSSEATTQATAENSEKTASPLEAPASQVQKNPGLQLPRGAISPTPLLSQQNETEVAQHPPTAGPQLPSVDTAALVAQGDQFLSKSDVASARQLYQRAAEAGDGSGALRMGMTFDPVFLARWRLRGLRGDRAQAFDWYRRASALGNAEAELMQSSVSRGAGSASHPVTAGQTARGPGIVTPHAQRNNQPHRARARQTGEARLK
jgi:hypothetical protein